MVEETRKPSLGVENNLNAYWKVQRPITRQQSMSRIILC